MSRRSTPADWGLFLQVLVQQICYGKVRCPACCFTVRFHSDCRDCDDENIAFALCVHGDHYCLQVYNFIGGGGVLHFPLHLEG